MTVTGLRTNVISAAIGIMLATQAAAYPLVQPDCREMEVKCALSGRLEFISVFGRIGEEDALMFEALDAALPAEVSFPTVFLNSPGGKVGPAMRIGRILRARGATVETGSPLVEDGRPQCSSACVLVAAGAVNRRLTHIGLHSSHVRVETGENVFEDVAVQTPEVDQYYAEMGIPAKVSEIEKRIPFDEMQHLFLDPTLPFDVQGIVKFGFFMPDVQPTPVNALIPKPHQVFLPYHKYMERAVENGSRAALRDIVQYYQRYDPDVPPDFAASAVWLKKGVEVGDPWAMHSLAYHYEQGLGVDRDTSKAIDLYRQASSLGLAASQNNLGWAYYTGNGVPQSLSDAIYWITRSAEQGEPFAYGSLCEIQAATDFLHDNRAEAYKWCQLALRDLDDGSAKDAAEAAIAKLDEAITDEDRAAGAAMVRVWRPLRQTEVTMRNVGEHLN